MKYRLQRSLETQKTYNLNLLVKKVWPMGLHHLYLFLRVEQLHKVTTEIWYFFLCSSSLIQEHTSRTAVYECCINYYHFSVAMNSAITSLRLFELWLIQSPLKSEKKFTLTSVDFRSGVVLTSRTCCHKWEASPSYIYSILHTLVCVILLRKASDFMELVSHSNTEVYRQ